MTGPPDWSRQYPANDVLSAAAAPPEEGEEPPPLEASTMPPTKAATTTIAAAAAACPADIALRAAPARWWTRVTDGGLEGGDGLGDGGSVPSAAASAEAAAGPRSSRCSACS